MIATLSERNGGIRLPFSSLLCPISPCLLAFGEVDDDVEANGEYFGGTGGVERRNPGLVGGLAILASLTELTALLCPLLLAYAPFWPSDIARVMGGREV